MFHPEVVCPKPALHYGLLPDDVLDFLYATFVNDARRPFPARLLEDLRWTGCTRCGNEHARPVCPVCSAGRNQPVFSRVRGRVTAEEVFATDGLIVAAALAGDGDELHWLHARDQRLENRWGELVADASAWPARAAYECGLPGQEWLCLARHGAGQGPGVCQQRGFRSAP